jgi:hypothetical protein
MMNYVSPFIPHYSTLMAPISTMNSKDFSYNKDKWLGIDYMVKWEEAKRAVCYATTLYLPDRTLPWTVKTDASKYGIGAVLTAMPVSTAPIPYLLASVFTVHGKVLSGR